MWPSSPLGKCQEKNREEDSGMWKVHGICYDQDRNDSKEKAFVKKFIMTAGKPSNRITRYKSQCVDCRQTQDPKPSWSAWYTPTPVFLFLKADACACTYVRMGVHCGCLRVGVWRLVVRTNACCKILLLSSCFCCT